MALRTYLDFAENDYNYFRQSYEPVSYTHLDVYKRQTLKRQDAISVRVINMPTIKPLDEERCV